LPAKITMLDDSPELRSIMSRLIKLKLGESVMCFERVEDLLSHADEVLHSWVVVLDVNLGEGQPSGIDAYEWLKEHDFQGKVFFLTGHARTHPEVATACLTGAEVWEKPMSSMALCSKLKTALETAAH
jgi:FixJ family two-component response regulator